MILNPKIGDKVKSTVLPKRFPTITREKYRKKFKEYDDEVEEVKRTVKRLKEELRAENN